jgi:hypothetical protein
MRFFACCYFHFFAQTSRVLNKWTSFQVRIQLGQGSAMHVAKNVIANEGFGGLYKVNRRSILIGN